MTLAQTARLLTVAVGVCATRVAAQVLAVDVLVTGGTVYDGSGAPGRRADIGWRGDRIVFVGNAAAAKVTAPRKIDASGLIVAPGFIDPHTHTQADLSNGDGRTNINYLMQGVTTVATNNDGGGTVQIGHTLAKWDTTGIGTNALLYVPQGSVRQRVMGMSDKPATTDEIERMAALVERGMKDGAFGLSAGLYYAPAS